MLQTPAEFEVVVAPVPSVPGGFSVVSPGLVPGVPLGFKVTLPTSPVVPTGLAVIL